MSRNDFYTVLARYYDELFGPTPTGLEFMREEAGGAQLDSDSATGRVVDVACGTGAWVRRLARSGLEVFGVDLSEAMITQGREIAAESGLDPDRLTAGDMMAIDDHPCVPFDLVYCIGNSISHLPTMEDIERFVAAGARALGSAGTLVLQYVTVGVLAVGDAFELPDLEAQGVTLERTYRRRNASEIEFEASLKVAGEVPQSISQRLLVIDDERMVGGLREAGFGSVDVYGGFDRSAPDETGWVRVFSCRRA